MKISFQDGSLVDYWDGFNFYHKISPHLSQKFYLDFWDSIAKIKANPKQYQERYRQIRIAFLNRFPFGIHYLLKDDRIIVLKILHTSRFLKI